MATTTDYTKMMKDMMGAMPMDTTAFTDMFKTQAALGEKMSKVALEAAEKSTEVSTKWTKATLAKAGELSTAKEDPADYTKAMTDFASASAETAAEHVAAFAEIAKKSADGHRRAADGCWQRHAGRKPLLLSRKPPTRPRKQRKPQPPSKALRFSPLRICSSRQLTATKGCA